MSTFGFYLVSAVASMGSSHDLMFSSKPGSPSVEIHIAL
jgi:hypothetical protein